MNTDRIDIMESVCVLPHPEIPEKLWRKKGIVISIESQNIDEILRGEDADLETQRIGLIIDGFEIPRAFYRDQIAPDTDA